MPSVLVAFLVVLSAITVVLVTLASYAWINDDTPAARPLVVVLLGQAVWCGAIFASGLVRGTWLAQLMWHVRSVSVLFVVAGLFCFSLAFTGRTEYLNRRTYALLSVEPIFRIGIIVTNYRNLNYSAVYQSEAAIAGVGFEWGAGFWAHATYSYLLLGVAMLLVLWSALGAKVRYRKHAYAVLISATLPVVGSIVHTLTEMALDPTPLAFSATGVVGWWALFHSDMLELEPIADREVVSSLNSAVFVVDADGRLVKRNEAAVELLGEQDTVGVDAESVLSEWPAFYEKFRPDVITEQERSAEVQQGGRYFDVLVSPLYDDRDRLVGQVYLVHEITEQKTRERELERRNRQLDQFASVVSHDLRNPLAVANGSLELAEQTGDETHFSRIRRAHDRMDTLIDQVLMLVHEDGEFNTAPYPLADLANQAWAHVDTGDATLTVETDDLLICNEDLTLQLFENAFRNSVEHAGQDCHIELTTVRESDDNGPSTDRILLSDDGPGIPEDQREVVFDHGMTTTEEGTGLGLAIIEKIVRSHGWSIRATSGPEGGLGLLISDAELKTSTDAEAGQ